MLIRYVKETDVSGIDYFGAGPLRPSVSKKDCGMDENGDIYFKKECPINVTLLF